VSILTVPWRSRLGDRQGILPEKPLRADSPDWPMSSDVEVRLLLVNAPDEPSRVIVEAAVAETVHNRATAGETDLLQVGVVAT
jgi:hypothetical protein